MGFSGVLNSFPKPDGISRQEFRDIIEPIILENAAKERERKLNWNFRAAQKMEIRQINTGYHKFYVVENVTRKTIDGKAKVTRAHIHGFIKWEEAQSFIMDAKIKLNQEKKNNE